jgi:signal transduction histidine kinase
MTGRRSLRSQLVVGSVLWTVGVMLFVSVMLIVFLATHPEPHAIILGWVLAFPLSVTTVVGLLCMAAGAWCIRRALSGMDRLGTRLASIRHGPATRIDGEYPAEMQPMVDALNELLADREARVDRAVARAGDLAHGLKTPLAVLASDATRAAAAGDAALAASVEAQIDRMRHQIDYHLAHARAAAASKHAGLRTLVGTSVDALLRTLARLHAERALDLSSTVDEESAVGCQREDLDEMLGNLLDNACKWTARCVRVSLASAADWVTIVIDDDGHGLDESLKNTVMQRGVRADERTPGSGFGLAIARELAELYGGTLELARSPLGGLQVRLRLPAAAPVGR